MKLNLDNDFLSLLLDTKGAYIDSLSFNGKDVFFNREKIDYNGGLKDRGGCHVCMPQFSKAGNFDLPNHGFGRHIDWVIVELTRKRVLLEALNQQDGPYGNLMARLDYELLDNRFIATLILLNKGEEDLCVSPAFHPYYKLGDKESLTVNGNDISAREERFVNTDYMENINEVKINGFKLKVDNVNLPVFALWSDMARDYFCLEPTYNGPSFFEGSGYYSLKPEEEMIFSFSIEVEEQQ